VPSAREQPPAPVPYPANVLDAEAPGAAVRAARIAARSAGESCRYPAPAGNAHQAKTTGWTGRSRISRFAQSRLQVPLKTRRWDGLHSGQRLWRRCARLNVAKPAPVSL